MSRFIINSEDIKKLVCESLNRIISIKESINYDENEMVSAIDAALLSDILNKYGWGYSDFKDVQGKNGKTYTAYKIQKNNSKALDFNEVVEIIKKNAEYPNGIKISTGKYEYAPELNFFILYSEEFIPDATQLSLNLNESEGLDNKIDDPNYTHYAVNKNTNLIVYGWDYTGYEGSELRQFKNDYFIVDLRDNDLNPKDYKILTRKGCISQGINPEDNNSWSNDGITPISQNNSELYEAYETVQWQHFDNDREEEEIFNDAVEAIEMSDGNIDFMEWYPAFQDVIEPDDAD